MGKDDENNVIKAYEGNRPYIFVSYSHNDEVKAKMIISFLVGEGYRIWYDAGIHPASIWRKVIADKIANEACKACLFIVSKESVNSNECKIELDYVANKKKKIIPICMQKTIIPNELEMLISREYECQAVDDFNTIRKKIGDYEEQLSVCKINDDEPEDTEFYVPSTTWGPNRISYNWGTVVDKPCFNSMVEHPQIGNEMNFVRIREYSEGSIYRDSVEVVAGKQYEVKLYYHNCAHDRFNEIGVGMAQNVLVSFRFPVRLQKGDAGVVQGIISSTSTNPRCIWDSCYLNANSSVYMAYVQNSAKLYNEGSANGSILDEKSLFGAGARIAYDNNYWGIIPGGEKYSGFITLRLQADAPAFWTKCLVKKIEDETFKDSIKVKDGDVLLFQIHYENTGTTAQNYVTLYEHLPEGIKFMPNSLICRVSYYPGKEFAWSESLLEKGVVIGNYNAGDDCYIEYRAIVNDVKKFGVNGYTYNNVSIATANGTMFSKVKLVRLDN